MDENTKELSGYVREVKSGEAFKEAFMTIGDHLDREREEGREEERKNTERERLRAEKERLRAEKAEAEIKALKEKLARLEAGMR